MAWRRDAALASLLCAVTLAQVSRQPDPASCRHYVTQPGGELTACPDDLLFDAVSLNCLPAAEANCSRQDYNVAEKLVPAIIRKCCPESQQLSLSQGQCIERPEKLSLPIFSSHPFNADRPHPVVGDAQYTLWPQPLDCGPIFTVNSQADAPQPIFLLDTGSLYVPEYKLIYTSAVYCVETFVSDADTAPRLGAILCSTFAPPDVIHLEDNRVEVQRCCSRGFPYDPEQECLINQMLHGDEVPPPLNLADLNIRQELAARAIDDVFQFSVDGPSCNDSLLLLSIGDRPFFLNLDGTLTTRHDNVSIPAGEFCVNERLTGFSDETGNVTTAVALICPTPLDAEARALLSAPAVAPTCDGQVCLRKCCPPGFEILVTDGAGDAQQMTCVFTWRQLNVSVSNAVPPELHAAPLLYGQPPCPGGLFEVTDGNFSVLPSGTFRLVQKDKYACNFQSVYDADSSTYCMDTKRGSNKSAHAFFCYAVVEDDSSSATYIFFPILMGITDFFLLVTIIVYLTVPDPTQIGLNKKRKLSQSVLGMILLAYISSLFFAYLVLIVVQTATGVLAIYRTACKVLAVILYFFLMAAFFWLSVICFEIYLSTRADKRTSGRKRFRLYAVYAWCCPLAMATLALIMDLAPGIDNCSVIKPAFGRYRCLFQNRKAYVVYFYIPVGVLLLACVLLYGLTVRNLSVPTKMPGRGESAAMSEQSAKQQKKRRMLCVKLFLIMGITWIAELLSFLIGGSAVWYFFDVINILQGFFIFVAFILRPKVLQYIKKSAQQALSRSFGHDSQHDAGGGIQNRVAPAGGDISLAQKHAGTQPLPSPMTMSTRLTSTRAAATGSPAAANC